MKNEISEQLRLLAKEIIENDTLQTSQIKEAALELYNKSAILEFLESKEEKSSALDFQDMPDVKAAQESTVLENQDPTSETLEVLEDLAREQAKLKEQEEDLLKDEKPEVEPKKDVAPKPMLNELELFASEFQNMPEFERKVEQPSSKTESYTKQSASKSKTDNDNSIHKKLTASKPKSLNDTIKQGLNIGLNDRLAFINQLFDGQTEDYTRVLSQINTFDSFEDAKSFVENQVKPDYNNWQNKEEFSGRFMTIIEKTFN